MAVQNEILTSGVSDDEKNVDVDSIKAEKDDVKTEGSAGNDSSGTVAAELEFEKKNAPGNNLAHAKGKQDLRNDSFEIQVEGEDAEGGEDIPDAEVIQKQANTYAAKKTVAQGMMDIALITANANQLRYIIEFNSKSSTYYLNLILISISLLLQVLVGVSLVFKGRMDLRGESKHKNAKRINNYVVVGIFLVTIINVFIASFTITGSGNT